MPMPGRSDTCQAGNRRPSTGRWSTVKPNSNSSGRATLRRGSKRVRNTVRRWSAPPGSLASRSGRHGRALGKYMTALELAGDARDEVLVEGRVSSERSRALYDRATAPFLRALEVAARRRGQIGGAGSLLAPFTSGHRASPAAHPYELPSIRPARTRSAGPSTTRTIRSHMTRSSLGQNSRRPCGSRPRNASSPSITGFNVAASEPPVLTQMSTNTGSATGGSRHLF